MNIVLACCMVAITQTVAVGIAFIVGIEIGKRLK